MRKLYGIAALAFTGFIFYNSSLPAPVSDENSYYFVNLISWINAFLDKPVPLEEMNHYIRKTAHFTEYFVQALLLCNAFQTDRADRQNSHSCILLLSLLTAVLDEYIQLFYRDGAARLRISCWTFQAPSPAGWSFSCGNGSNGKAAEVK